MGTLNRFLCKPPRSKHTCSTCGTDRFGLVRQEWLGYQFCSKGCLADFLAKRARQIEQTKRWLQHHKPG
jgi:hypothetical protein